MQAHLSLALSFLFVSLGQTVASDLASDHADSTHSAASAVSSSLLVPMDESDARRSLGDGVQPADSLTVGSVAGSALPASPAPALTGSDSQLAVSAALSASASATSTSSSISPASSAAATAAVSQAESAGWTISGALSSLSFLRGNSPAPEVQKFDPNQDRMAPFQKKSYKGMALQVVHTFSNGDFESFLPLKILDILPVLQNVKTPEGFKCVPLTKRIKFFDASTYEGVFIFSRVNYGKKPYERWSFASEHKNEKLAGLFTCDDRVSPSQWLTDHYADRETMFLRVGGLRKDEDGSTFAWYGLEVGDQAFILEVTRKKYAEYITLLTDWHLSNHNLGLLQEICMKLSADPDTAADGHR